MAQSLADLKTQLHDRLTELRPLVDEYRQLERAAGALGIDGNQPRAVFKPPGRGAPKAKARAKARAPRGANKAAITAVLAERPGVTVAEIADVTGIAKPLIYNTTRAGITQGDMESVDLGGGRKGFKLVAVDAAPDRDSTPAAESTPAVNADPEADSASTTGSTETVDTSAAGSPAAAKSSPKRARKRQGKRKAQVATADAGGGSDGASSEAPGAD